jgi:uncharacterized membrane protein
LKKILTLTLIAILICPSILTLKAEAAQTALNGRSANSEHQTGVENSPNKGFNPFNAGVTRSTVIENAANKARVLQPPDAKILIDEVHQDFVTTYAWRDFIIKLQGVGYSINALSTGATTSDILQQYNVLIIGSAWGEFSTSELQAIKGFVSNGGGLFLLGVGWSWIDSHANKTIQDYPMNKIAGMFGLFFNDDMIFDPTNNTGNPGNPIFHRMFPHPITEGVNKVCVPKGNPCSISAGSAQIVITGDEDSYSGYHEKVYKAGDYPPVLAVTFYETGKVVCLGHDGFFSSIDDDGNGIINLNEYDNLQLGLNIIKWLQIPGLFGISWLTWPILIGFIIFTITIGIVVAIVGYRYKKGRKAKVYKGFIELKNQLKKLDEVYERGEISRDTYTKIRAELEEQLKKEK